DCVAALEVTLFGLGRPLPVLDCHPPLAAPGTGDVDPVDSVDAAGRFLIDRVLHDDVAVRNQHARSRLVELGQLVAQPVLDVVGVDPVVHDVEGGIEAGRYAAHVRVGDHEAGPLVGRQGLED